MTEEECGFRKECTRISLDVTFTVQQTIGKIKEYNLLLFLLFVDYEKAYDNVTRDILWKMVENKIPNLLLEKIKRIYEIEKFSAKFSDDTVSEPNQINKGLREGCGFSSILFNMYTNTIIQEFKVVIKKGHSTN